MTDETTIFGLLIRHLPAPSAAGPHLTPLLEFDDHLLRRFGGMDWLELAEGERFGPILRETADEIWFLIEGQIDAYWLDTRPSSPTLQARDQLRLEDRSLALVPFGVGFGCRSGPGGARLLRLMTDAPDPSQREGDLSWEALLEA